MKKSIFSIVLTLIFLSLLNPTRAFADTTCQPIYGGGQTCVTTENIKINKTILNPETNQFVDNLGINDPKYQPGYVTTFKITVTNASDNTFSRVEVKDIFPQYVSFSAGPGNFDDKTKTLTFTMDDLKKDESRTFTIMGRVDQESSIPFNGNIICVVNQAIAKTNTNTAAQDNAQFCIAKPIIIPAPTGFPVFPKAKVKVTPPTGPEMWSLIALIPTGIAGFVLRKKSIKYN